MQKRNLVGLGILGAIGLLALAPRGALANTAAAGGIRPEAAEPADGSAAGEADVASEQGDAYNPYTPDIVPASDDINARVAALAALIRKLEANGDYTVLYGGGHFSDFSRHPNVRVPFFNPKTGKQDFSTAAGAYQINYPTYSDIGQVLGVSDFSPDTQDQLALYLIRKTGAYNALALNDVQGALRLASSRWASLPGSSSGQRQASLQAALDTYNGYLEAMTA